MKKLIFLLLFFILPPVSADTLVDADNFFNWAEKNMSEFFPSAETSQTFADIWYFRYYPKKNYLLTVNTEEKSVYIFNNTLSNELIYVSNLSELMRAIGLHPGDIAGQCASSGNLMWEVKSIYVGDLQNKDKTYQWESLDSADKIGPWVTSPTTTKDYINDINFKQLCGFSDWRLPTATELENMGYINRSPFGDEINKLWLDTWNAQDGFKTTYYWWTSDTKNIFNSIRVVVFKAFFALNNDKILFDMDLYNDGIYSSIGRDDVGIILVRDIE